MKKMLGLVLSIALVFAGFGLGGVNTTAEEEFRDFEKNARWHYVQGEYETASPIYKIVDAVVGVPVKVKFFVQNNQKVNVSYRLGFDLTDNGNRESWMEGDRKSLQLDKVTFTLKPGQKQDVTVTVTVNKSHSGHAFWAINIIPDKGTRDNVFLYVCQYDTKAEITNNYAPPKVDTFNQLLKHKTKIGYIVRTDCFTVVVYGNKHVYCFNKEGSRRWTYSSGKSINDFSVLATKDCNDDSFINAGQTYLNPANGDHASENDTNSFIIDSKSSITMSNYNQVNWFKKNGDCMLYCKQYLHCLIKWVTFSDSMSFRYPYVFKSLPNRLLIKKTPIEFFPGHYECIDPRNGTTLFSVAPGSVYREQTFIDDKLKIIVAKGDFGDSRRGGHCQVWDVENCKNLLDDKSCGPTRTTISGSLLVYSDFKSTSCYDYVSRKMLWTLKGDGAPLCEPIVDDKHEFFYILDEDSTWLPGEYSAKRVTGPNYVRLYKFNLKTGKKVWETKIFSIPKEQGTFYDYEVRDLGIEYGLIYNEVSIDKGKIEIKLNRNKFKFTVRASDGKPVR